MTETRLNSDHQQKNPYNPAQEALHDASTSVAFTQHTPGPQHPPAITMKKVSTFKDPIYRLLGFNSRNSHNQANCTGREVGTLIMWGVLMILFMLSVTGFFIMWFTDIYNNQYIYKLVLSNNSVATEWWRTPPLNTHLKVHIFNYTNIDRYLKGLDDKIKLEDLGPYTYIENATKVDVVFNNNYTVTYKERRSYKFSPEMSKGKQYDKVVVPNVPFLSAIATINKMQSYISKKVASLGLAALNPKPFNILPADSLLWGYDDEVVSISKKISPTPLPFEKFGMLVNRNGTGQNVFQIFTGEDDIRKLGVISEFNGKNKLNFWSTEECNRVDGTDGSQFPPHLMDKKQKLQVFIQAFCRKLPLAFDSEINLFDGVPAWRYKTPLNVFAHPSINPENQCYCHIESGACPPSGLFNGTLCYDAPVFVSFPHFFTADPSVYDIFEGINPIAEKHQTYADVHPRLAFPIDGASRIQINIQLQKGAFVTASGLKDGIILPVLWIEVTSGELTDELRTLIYHSSFSANAIQLALKYGTLLSCVASLSLLVGSYYLQRRGVRQRGPKERELRALNRSAIKNTNEIAADGP